MERVKPRTMPGTMELLPREQVVLQRFLDTIRAGYERFGFLPIETPVIEMRDVLLTKSGGDTEKQVYFVQSTGSLAQGEPPKLAMRFDLTVPLARYVAQHEHDDEVGSIALEAEGDADPQKFNAWLSVLLREHGVDIFRMKGFVSIAGEPRRFVFQGVHMLFDGQPDRPWGDAPRRSQLVFIGRNLDEERMRQGFEACLN